jgi:amino-acid N-acetyltransferase
MSANTEAAKMEIRVRDAADADFDAVRALVESAHLPTDGLADYFGPAYAVAECDGRVIGAEGIERHGSAGLLRSAVVDDRYRGRGVGDLLTRDRLSWARASGLDEVWLLTTTAAEYFPRFGFSTADRAAAPPALQESVEFREACPASAVAMRLSFTREIEP